LLIVVVGDGDADAAAGVADAAEQLQVFDAGADQVEGGALRRCRGGLAEQLAQTLEQMSRSSRGGHRTAYMSAYLSSTDRPRTTPRAAL
jgi:hypothetical protein